MWEKLKVKINKYKHAWPLLYVFIYMPTFTYLEKHFDVVSKTHIIHSPIDDMIPFCEFFVIPYIIWFLYIPTVFIFLFYHSKNEFYRLCAYEFLGMSICLLIYFIYPNGLNLRLVEFPRDNVFTDIVRYIYDSDTPTNVCPSIHVFATISAHICLIKSSHMQFGKTRQKIKVISLIITIMICLSTIFLKQHSIIDLVCGALLSFILYFFIFDFAFKKIKFPGPVNVDTSKHQVLYFLNKDKK